MADEPQCEPQGLVSPGAMLRVARESQEISPREAADRLHWMPGYVAIIEGDNFTALRRPSFARGYVKAFGHLLKLDENTLMAAFDALENESDSVSPGSGKSSSAPLHLQKTGVGVIVGLACLFLLFGTLWWWQGNVS